MKFNGSKKVSSKLRKLEISSLLTPSPYCTNYGLLFLIEKYELSWVKYACVSELEISSLRVELTFFDQFNVIN